MIFSEFLHESRGAWFTVYLFLQKIYCNLNLGKEWNQIKPKSDMNSYSAKISF